MKISARVDNRQGSHEVRLQTNDKAHSLSIAPKESGLGSGTNGGELLMLALATCYCNDIYREAAKRGIHVERVEVEVDAEFGGEGEPARGVTYRAKVAARAPQEEIQLLMRETDRVAEIQNTLRAATEVTLSEIEAEVIERPDPGEQIDA